MRGRAIRRHHMERMKQKITKMVRDIWQDRRLIEDESWMTWERRKGIMAKTRQPCSCSMCGHRRRWEGKTFQEKKHEDSWKDAA